MKYNNYENKLLKTDYHSSLEQNINQNIQKNINDFE